MDKIYKTISKNSTGEYIEKKSKFIANVYYVDSKEQVEEILKGLRKKYYDSKHICYAYSIDGENKASDDGEPSRTAGEPILNIITKNNLNNVLITVVRYFGGILLGTGGLVKAYTTASLNALEQTEFVKEEDGEEAEIEIEYSEIEKFKYFCKKQNINIVSSKYDNNVKYIIEINGEDRKNLENSGNFNTLKTIKNKKIRK